MGLPSGTLWLDRLVGAKSHASVGLFYQWGAIVGHDIAEGYNFSMDNYNAQGLNHIRTDLNKEHDAASAYYGDIAKMPSLTQLEELVNNCVLSTREDNLMVITSNINGNSIIIPPTGIFIGQELTNIERAQPWSSHRVSNSYASSLHLYQNEMFVGQSARHYGYCIMAVHS